MFLSSALDSGQLSLHGLPRTIVYAVVPKEMPKKLWVVGSGAIGIEFASFYNSMGADVTVVEIMDQVMPVEDA